MQTFNLLWLQSGGCGGCSMSVLNAENPDLFQSLRQNNINLLWHPSFSETSDKDFLDLLEQLENRQIRHSVNRPGESLDFAAGQLQVAIGSCAAFGGITMAGPNPGEACGLQYEGSIKGGLLGASWNSGQALPVINIAGCPTHPNWVVETLILLAMGMMEHLGCLGTQARADCNTRLWNGEGSCLRGGYACINCTAPEFENTDHCFSETPKIAGIPVGLPTDMPKAWFVALASLSKAATPKRLKVNAVSDHIRIPPGMHEGGEN